MREAVAKGYAEPDPREDLSGQDVLRKGLILARLLGYAGPAPVAENLVPPALRRLPLARFLDRLSSLDEAWRRRVATEAARGRVLRYVVVATARGVARLAAGRPARLGLRLPPGHAEPAVLHHAALPRGAARRGRPRRRRRGHRRRHPERHPVAGERLAWDTAELTRRRPLRSWLDRLVTHIGERNAPAWPRPRLL